MIKESHPISATPRKQGFGTLFTGKSIIEVQRFVGGSVVKITTWL